MPPKCNVSVIIPTYNRAILLDRAIKSVLAQTWKDFELLVIDDGSREDIASIVSSQQDSRIRLICHDANLGLAAAWNTGVQEVSTDLVAFLDSDDTWEPEKLSKQMRCQEAHPEINAFGTGYYQTGLSRKTIIIPRQKQALYKSILFQNILHLGTTFLIRRSVFDRVGLFDENLLRGQDTDWLLRYAQTDAILIIQEPLAMIYQHTNRSAEKLEASRLHMIERHLDEYSKFGIDFKRRKLAKMYADIAYQYEREDHQLKMLAYATKSIKSNPLQLPGIYLILLDSLTGWHTKKLAWKIKHSILKASKNDG